VPEEAAIRAEERRRLDRRIAALPPDYALVIRLVHDQGLTLVAAADRMGRSADAVRKLYGRAVAQLTKDLRGEADGR
jgi:RNA polymerase sigma factor (sigma-70 family)